MTTDEIRRVRYTQVIKDPFPEHTAFNQFQDVAGLFGRFFDRFFLPPGPAPVSIWAAYKQGYDKAYEEMLAAADLTATTPKEEKA